QALRSTSGADRQVCDVRSTMKVVYPSPGRVLATFQEYAGSGLAMYSSSAVLGPFTGPALNAPGATARAAKKAIAHKGTVRRVLMDWLSYAERTAFPRVFLGR